MSSYFKKMYNENTMIGLEAGVTMSPSEYEIYYSDATKDLNDRRRRIKSNYLIEKLKEIGTLKEFEYQYIYDASACNHMKKLIFNIIPIILIHFLRLSGFFSFVTFLCCIPLIATVLYNLIWIPCLIGLKNKHFYIKSCICINIIATIINAIIVYKCLF